MLPALVVIQAEIDLYEGPPFGALRFSNEQHSRLTWGPIGLPCVAGDTGADNVFPSGRTAAIARDDVVEIQFTAVKDEPTVLAGVEVALEDIVAGELHFLFGHAIENEEQDHPGHADSKGDGVDTIRCVRAFGEVFPLAEVIGLKSTVIASEDNLGLSFEEESERSTG